MHVKHTARLLLQACFLLFGLALLGCTDENAPKQEVVRPVRTIVVAAPQSSIERIFSGTARDDLETALSFRVGGELIELPAKIGRKVKQGDIIARLDPTDYRLQHQQAVADRERAHAAFVQAKADIDRVKKLYEKKVVSKSELDKAQAAYDSANAQLSASRQQVDIALQRLKYTTLTAPVAGRLASVPVDLHQTVTSGQPIATLNSGGEMEVEVGVPDALISQIDMGQQVDVTFDVRKDKTCAATVSEIGVKPGVSSTYPLRVKLADCTDFIRSGMTASVTFNMPRQDASSVLVPAVAVVGDADGSNHVWVVENNVVHRRKVTPLRLTSAGLEIADGLNPGEVLVVRGMHSVEEGMTVHPTPLNANF